MIALVRLPAPPGAGNGTAELASLPEPPASRYTAFAVHGRDEGEVCEALAWYRTILESRPGTPLGLVAHATDCVQPVADLGRSLVFVMDPSRLNGGGLPGTALEALREAGVEGRILEEIVRQHGPQVLSRREAIETVIARAAAGGTLSDGRTEIIVVRPPLDNAVAYDDASDRALELRQLRSSVKMLLPRVRSFGRIIEVEITYELTAG